MKRDPTNLKSTSYSLLSPFLPTLKIIAYKHSMSFNFPIIVHPLLRPIYEARLQTYREFVTSFAQICEVSPVCPLIISWSLLTLLGRLIYAREPRRSSVCCYLSHAH